MENECQREIELINDLLDLQRLEAASYSTSYEVVNLQDWLLSIIEPFQIRTQERQQKLRVEFSSSLAPIISDAATLGRILTELLNNACKYTPEAGEIILSVRQERDEGTAEDKGKINAGFSHSSCSTIFTISNQAEIPSTELPRIFEKFYRVPSGDR